MIWGWTGAILSMKGQMSGFVLNVDPSRRSASTAALCGFTRITWGREINQASIMCGEVF